MTGGEKTSLTVYMLVDIQTVSAADIFAVALQDNWRALVIGTSNTFGKGMIQNVQPLNGSGVNASRAGYVTIQKLLLSRVDLDGLRSKYSSRVECRSWLGELKGSTTWNKEMKQVKENCASVMLQTIPRLL